MIQSRNLKSLSAVNVSDTFSILLSGSFFISHIQSICTAVVECLKVKIKVKITKFTKIM